MLNMLNMQKILNMLNMLNIREKKAYCLHKIVYLGLSPLFLEFVGKRGSSSSFSVSFPMDFLADDLGTLAATDAGEGAEAGAAGAAAGAVRRRRARAVRLNRKEEDYWCSARRGIGTGLVWVLWDGGRGKHLPEFLRIAC